MTEDRRISIHSDDPHLQPSDASADCGRRPWRQDKHGKTVVYERDEPRGSGPLDRFLFPQFEPARFEDRFSQHEFAVAMVDWFAKRTVPMAGTSGSADIAVGFSDLAEIYVRTYLDGKRHVHGLNGLLWDFKNRQDLLRGMIEDEEDNAAYSEALRRILKYLRLTSVDIPAELQEWELSGDNRSWQAGYGPRKRVVDTDNGNVAYALVQFCGVLHAVVESKFPLTHADSSPYSICGAVAKVMTDRGFEMGYHNVVRNHRPKKEQLDSYRNTVRKYVLRTDRNGIHGNDVAILNFLKSGRVT